MWWLQPYGMYPAVTEKECLVLKKKFMDVHTSIVKSWLDKKIIWKEEFCINWKIQN